MSRTTDHGEKLHEVPDEYLTEALPVAKKIATALGAENYNLLQVNLLFKNRVFDVSLLIPHT